MQRGFSDPNLYRKCIRENLLSNLCSVLNLDIDIRLTSQCSIVLEENELVDFSCLLQGVIIQF